MTLRVKRFAGLSVTVVSGSIYIPAYPDICGQGKQWSGSDLFIHSLIHHKANIYWRPNKQETMLRPSAVPQSCLTLCNSMDWGPPRLLCPWGFSRQECWSELPCHPPRDLPNPGIKPRSPTLLADSLPSEPPRKPKNTGVQSLPYNQEIFISTIVSGGLTCGLRVKNLPAMQKLQETSFRSLGWEDPLEEGMATHSSITA